MGGQDRADRLFSPAIILLWRQVLCVLEAMDRHGCDFLLDLHGDEGACPPPSSLKPTLPASEKHSCQSTFPPLVAFYFFTYCACLLWMSWCNLTLTFRAMQGTRTTVSVQPPLRNKNISLPLHCRPRHGVAELNQAIDDQPCLTSTRLHGISLRPQTWCCHTKSMTNPV